MSLDYDVSLRTGEKLGSATISDDARSWLVTPCGGEQARHHFSVVGEAAAYLLGRHDGAAIAPGTGDK